MFVADDLGAWLVGLLADMGRKKLTTLILGSEQERALRQAATAAALLTARELRPGDRAGADELATVISRVFREPLQGVSASAQASLLEALQVRTAQQLAVLLDTSMPGEDRSSAEALGIPIATLADSLSRHLVREILNRGARGGPLEPLAAQLNHDVTHLQGQRLEDALGQLAGEVRAAVAKFDLPGDAASASLDVRFSLPPDVPDFVDREEVLAAIAAEARATAGGVRIHAIGGMAGLGKTALAVHAAHGLRERFPDRQLFIDLHGHTPGEEPVTAEIALAGLLTATGVDASSLPGDVPGMTALWRDRTAGQRTLLVLDNAASSTQVIPLVPSGPDSLVLVTSRRHLGDLPAGAAAAGLQVLSRAEARELFVRLAPRAAGDPADAMAELTELAGCLPMAISLLARVYARHPSWTLDDLVSETKERMMEMAAESHTVAASLELSYRHLSPAQQQFFCRLGVHPGTSIDRYAAAAVTGTSVREARAQLDALHSEGMLTELGYSRYGMHDLIRRYARDIASDAPAGDSTQALERLLDYYQYTATLSEDLLARQTRTARPPMPQTVPAEFPALPDRSKALAWARAERQNLMACIDCAARAAQPARVVALTAVIAAIMETDGPWADAVARHTAAAAAARSCGDDAARADALSALGAVLSLTGDNHGAVVPLTEALGIYRDIADVQGQGNALHSLADALRTLGDQQAATANLTQALDLFRALGDRRGQANALLSSGIVLWMTAGNEGAATALSEALGIYRAIGDQPGTANAMIDLSAVWRRTGRYDRALTDLTEALEICRAIGDRRGQAMALLNLGNVRWRTGEYEGAGAALAEALDICHAIGDRLFQANVMNQLGNVQRRTADPVGAAISIRAALSIFSEIGNRRGQANSLSYLGGALRQAGQYTAASGALDEALTMFRDLGDGRCEAEVLNEIGALGLARGDLNTARQSYTRALDLARQVASPWEEAVALAGLAHGAEGAGDVADASARLQEARKIFRQMGAAGAGTVELGDPASAAPG